MQALPCQNKKHTPPPKQKKKIPTNQTKPKPQTKKLCDTKVEE